MTPDVIAAHLSGDVDLGLYPLLPGDRCQWLAADFDGEAAMLDALAYLKAARGTGVPAALEVSRSGLGAHVWIFFTSPVNAEIARRMVAGLLREAITLRGRMDLRSYDRLFPSQDVLPDGGFGNLIAAPLQGRCRRDGATVFLDLGTLEPQEDQFAYLSSVGRMTARDVSTLANRVGSVAVGAGVERLRPATTTRTRPAIPPVITARLGAGVRVEMEQLTPALLATLKHAASMPNPLFYERQRRRASTWDTPRFLLSYDEILDGGLILPRGLLGVVNDLVREAGSTLEITDERTSGTPQEFTFTEARTAQVVGEVLDALRRGRHCLLLTQWTAHVDRLREALSGNGLDPVVLRSGMGAKARRAALERLASPVGGLLDGASPLLAVAAGPYPGKTTAEVHDYHDTLTGVLASSLAKRAPGYTSLGFPDPRRH